MNAPCLEAVRTTVAVLGARDSGARDLARTLTEHQQPTSDPASPPHHMRILVDASPEDRPDIALLVVDSVCPIRPDDLLVARGISARIPLLVLVAPPEGGLRVPVPRHTALAIGRSTVERLTAAGIAAQVAVLDPKPTIDDGTPTTEVAGSPAGTVPLLSIDTLAEHLASPQSHPAGAEPPSPAPGPALGTMPNIPSAAGTADWLTARRTEAITSRTSALRQDVQSLRLELVQDLHRSLRDLGIRARVDIGAASRTGLPRAIHSLSADADAAVARVAVRLDQMVEVLISRHLGSSAPAITPLPVPTGAIHYSTGPRHRGEEVLMMLMGAAGGTGVGRMLLSPLSGLPALSGLVVPLAILAGLLLGWTTVNVRRTQAQRAYLLAVTVEQMAGLRTEVEQSLGSRILAAEATITDAVAHNPGPRVLDLERRLRTLRGRA